VASGKSATTRPPLNLSPRTPVGPSESRSSPSPIDAWGRSVNTVAPVSSRTFAGRSSVLISAAWSSDVIGP
jgi:hypothetical protein